MFKVLDGGKLPTRGTKYSACVDLYAREDCVIGAGETNIVPLGVKIDLEELQYQLCDQHIIKNCMDEDGIIFDKELADAMTRVFLKSHKLDLHIRSSLSAKKGLVIANGTGQIDLDYPDEIGIILHNPVTGISVLDREFGKSNEDRVEFLHSVKITAGDRVAQITLVEHKSYLFGIESEEERTGGFGSTIKRMENEIN
jgi:dUTPase